MERENRNNEGEREGSWLGTAAKIAGVAAAAGGMYWLLTKDKSSKDSEPGVQTSSTRNGSVNNTSTGSIGFGLLGSFVSSLMTPQESAEKLSIVPEASIPSRPCITNLNSLLTDIFVRHVALKKDDFELHYRVFSEVFAKIHRSMKAVDPYFNRYSSNIQYAGSHYDRLKIKKPDEFDVDIVVGLPVSMDYNRYSQEASDIIIEQKYPGFVQLRGGVQYQKLLVRDGVDATINKTAYSWLDERNYILRSRFTDWFKSVGIRALNQFHCDGNRPYLFVDGVKYFVTTSASGPAWTIIITAPGFRLDVDLVPALKFPESRWPVGRGYRDIPSGCNRGYWMVVPKPNKGGQTMYDENRSWRIALQDQENKFLYKTEKMRTIIRLIKYLRDSLCMDKIASYYIKTIFFNEITDLQLRDAHFWQRNDLQTCYIYMVNKFYQALCSDNIPYFWNKQHNLIGNLNCHIKNEYKRKLSKVLDALADTRDYKNIAKCILAPYVYNEYERFLN